MEAKIERITIGRLYNLGNYEHIRYELTATVHDGQSASTIVRGMENILVGLAPLKGIREEQELENAAVRIEALRNMTPEAYAESEMQGYGQKEGRIEKIDRLQNQLTEERKKRDRALARQAKCRQLFDDLGGASEWKDAKQNWQDDDDF